MEKFLNADKFKNVIDEEKISTIIKLFNAEIENKKPGEGQFVLIDQSTKGFASLNDLEFEKLKSLGSEAGWKIIREFSIGGEVYYLKFKCIKEE
mgnify:FL=1